MNYDHYSVANSIADSLDVEGHADWAMQLKNVIAEGATGTEILMGLRWHLRRLKDSGLAISPSVQIQVDELLAELNKALA